MRSQRADEPAPDPQSCQYTRTLRFEGSHQSDALYVSPQELRPSDLFCQEDAKLELIGNPLRFAPALEQYAAALGVALLQGLGAFDAVGAEMAEVLAHLAPGGDDAGAVEEGERDRPDDALRLLAFLVAVGDLHFALFADRLADRRQVGRLHHIL